MTQSIAEMDVEYWKAEAKRLTNEVSALRDELQMALFDFGMKQKDIDMILAACVQDRQEQK